MMMNPSKSFERNSRLSLALVKNRAEQNILNTELDHLEKEKKTMLRMLQNDKQCFKIKYSKSNIYADYGGGYNTYEMLSKYFIPSVGIQEDELTGQIGGERSDKNSIIDFEEIRNMLFTNEEIDKEKILCLHLISAHRTESLAPPKKKLSSMCRIHSPVERLLERSKRKNIHLEQKMANMLPIYTIEITEFGPQTERRDLINDGRLATRILLNEKIRELINTVFNALKQSNPDKNYEILEMANDISCLKKLFTKRKIQDFLDALTNCSLINSCESFVLTAPFRVKSVQLEIRTISGSLEGLVKQIRQNVLQLPTRPKLKLTESVSEEVLCCAYSFANRVGKRIIRRASNEGMSRNLEDLYSEKQPRRSSDPEKKLGRHTDTNFIQKNIDAAATTKKIEYDSDEDDEYRTRSRGSSSSRSRRRSSEQSGRIHERPNIQPIKIPDQVAVIMEEAEENSAQKEDDSNTVRKADEKGKEQPKEDPPDARTDRRRSSASEGGSVRFHLKQTTCPACMEKYKIPLPTPKTPKVKASSVLPLAPGENPTLKTNSQNRISMLINKEMFKLQSYERRFSSDETARRNSLRRKELEACSSSYLNLSPLELARIEQEIKEKETQKKLSKFLNE